MMSCGGNQVNGARCYSVRDRSHAEVSKRLDGQRHLTKSYLLRRFLPAMPAALRMEGPCQNAHWARRRSETCSSCRPSDLLCAFSLQSSDSQLLPPSAVKSFLLQDSHVLLTQQSDRVLTEGCKDGAEAKPDRHVLARTELRKEVTDVSRKPAGK